MHIFQDFNNILVALMSGEKALARIGGFSKLVKTNQKGTVNYWRQEKSKPDWGYIQPQNMMEDTIPFNASDRLESWNSKRIFTHRFQQCFSLPSKREIRYVRLSESPEQDRISESY